MLKDVLIRGERGFAKLVLAEPLLPQARGLPCFAPEKGEAVIADKSRLKFLAFYARFYPGLDLVKRESEPSVAREQSAHLTV